MHLVVESSLSSNLESTMAALAWTFDLGFPRLSTTPSFCSQELVNVITIERHRSLLWTIFLRTSAALVFAIALVVAASQSAHGQKFTVVYSFAGGNDGQAPYAGLVRDSAGNLYGTTYFGGGSGYGTVFKVDPTGKKTVLHNFTGGIDGAFPLSMDGRLLLDAAGNLYGTTDGGGIGGTVFKMDPTGKNTVLYDFPKANHTPLGGVIRDRMGNFYGTTYVRNHGTVYELDRTGKPRRVRFFSRFDGVEPYAGLIRDSTGNLYGTTTSGGPHNSGIVFKLDKTFNETILYSFTGGADGRLPYASLVRDAQGNLYGTTYQGGGSGMGVVFKLDTTNTETVFYSFTGGADGGNPEASLFRDKAGNLYGTAAGGGDLTCNVGPLNGCGVVFKLDTTGKETVLHTFTGRDGGNPSARLIRDSAGNFYGTTAYGNGSTVCGGGCGVVFKLKP
jgi:uncharacterized repeat protein (TIGR03803 family)